MPSVELLGGPETPTIIRITQGRSARTCEIHDPFIHSLVIADACIEHLDEAYGEDLNGDIWPITRKES